MQLQELGEANTGACKRASWGNAPETSRKGLPGAGLSAERFGVERDEPKGREQPRRGTNQTRGTGGGAPKRDGKASAGCIRGVLEAETPVSPKRIGHLQGNVDPIPNRSEVGPGGLSRAPQQQGMATEGFMGGPGAAPKAFPQPLASATLCAPSHLQSRGAPTSKKPIPECPPEEQIPQR